MKNPENIQAFLDLTIEEIFADRYSRYSKYIIQDRALPDVRDGLKPVQRRILYSMNKEGNTFDKQFRKSAKTVGNVIGNYHPHGDSSVYEAMVRMSQSWKVNQQTVIMHGNNGSIDGDSAAAMRYTEAKLSKYAEIMLQDINENTVIMVPNFDDTELEPTVLPTKIPNLLINGSSGISAGYATDIPPHNPGEIIKATIYLNQNPECSLDDLIKIVPGPDFPTGPTVQGALGIRQAYESGRGKIVMHANYRFDKNDIIISSLPYDVNKSTLLQRIDLLRIDKKIDGISEVVDQSDRDILEIVISCKKDVDKQVVLNYLFKNTDLQKNYNFNMIAINNRKPMLMDLKGILNSFLRHRREVIANRSQFRLEKAQTRMHIVDGLIKAISILDEIVEIIRKSKDKADSKKNIISKYAFSEVQAEAIVMMQLYRLSNTDITQLEEDLRQLEAQVDYLNAILHNPKRLDELITEELEEVYTAVKKDRITKIEAEISKIEIDKRDLIKAEKMIVSVTKNGYIKRSSPRSFLASTVITNSKEEDIVIDSVLTNTKHNVVIFFNDGTYVVIPVHELVETKWRDIGKHISAIAKINDGIEVIKMIATNNFNDYNEVVAVTREGYYTKVLFKEFMTAKLKQKIVWQKLKQADSIVSVSATAIEGLNIFDNYRVMFLTNFDRVIIDELKNIDQFNLKRVGKKIIKLRKDEEVIATTTFIQDISIFTDKAGYLYYQAADLPNIAKPTLLFNNIKSNPHTVIKVLSDFNYEVNLVKNDSTDMVVAYQTLHRSHLEERIKIIDKNSSVIAVEQIIDVN